MSDNHIDWVRDAIERNLPAMPDQQAAFTSRNAAQDLHAAGLLATPEHDAAVAAKAWSEGCAAGLREANDKARGVQNNPAINPYERKTGETDEWR